MISNTLWTQQMLNILISWLRDHTHFGGAAPAHSRLSQRRSKTATPNTLVPSSPALFITLLFFRLNLSAVGPSGSWATGNTGVWAVIRVSVTAEGAEDWRWTDTWSVVAAAPLWDDWSQLLAPEIKINGTSCLYNILTPAASTITFESIISVIAQ